LTVGLSIFGVTTQRGIKKFGVANTKGVKRGWGLHFAIFLIR